MVPVATAIVERETIQSEPDVITKEVIVGESSSRTRNYKYELERKLGKFFSRMFVIAKKLKSCLPLI